MAAAPRIFSQEDAGFPSLPVACPVCEHGNPTGARFCNQCGSPVHLLECAACDAINDGAAESCYKCAQPLRQGSARPDSSAWSSADAAGVGPSSAGDEIPALKECPHCGAVNDPAATLCHGCDGFLPNLDEGPVAQVGVATAPAHSSSDGVPAHPDVMPGSDFERPEAPLESPGAHLNSAIDTHGFEAADDSNAPSHYVGVLTARPDEAELEFADPSVTATRTRARWVPYAAAALLLTPSLIAAAVYSVQHRDHIDRVLSYARAVVLPTHTHAAGDAQLNAQTPSPSRAMGEAGNRSPEGGVAEPVDSRGPSNEARQSAPGTPPGS
ncbi:MAG: zinc ribbon domain-containing protein [Pseudomonadota bacterium]|nr:zinc ribbon domain-containing protein [Pseudomonadota bacterium]